MLTVAPVRSQPVTGSLVATVGAVVYTPGETSVSDPVNAPPEMLPLNCAAVALDQVPVVPVTVHEPFVPPVPPETTVAESASVSRTFRVAGAVLVPPAIVMTSPGR